MTTTQTEFIQDSDPGDEAPFDEADQTFAIVALGYHVVVEVLVNAKSSGGILLAPATTTSEQRWAKVIAVGDGEVDKATGRQIDIPLVPGDLVTIAPNRGVECYVGNAKLMSIPYNEIYFAVRRPHEDGADWDTMGDKLGDVR